MMLKSLLVLLATATIITAPSIHAEVPAPSPEKTSPPSTGDSRQFVSMPEQARALMRQDMLNHLITLSTLTGLLATRNLATAAEVAENEMGKSSMGKHRASGMGPGRFMPLEMRQLGWGMHESASEFAEIARRGDLSAAYVAFQNITSSCIACHHSYRTR